MLYVNQCFLCLTPIGHSLIFFFLVLQIDLLAEISIAPRIMSDVDGTLKSKQLKTEFDEYLKVKYFSCSCPFYNFGLLFMG
jgi:hypothetical protein